MDLRQSREFTFSSSFKPKRLRSGGPKTPVVTQLYILPFQTKELPHFKTLKIRLVKRKLLLTILMKKSDLNVPFGII